MARYRLKKFPDGSYQVVGDMSKKGETPRIFADVAANTQELPKVMQSMGEFTAKQRQEKPKFLSFLQKLTDGKEGS